MPRSLIWSCCSWFDGVDSDGGWAEVADAFECLWAGAVAAFGDGPAGDLNQNVEDGVVPVLRGESPPYL
jgi:hypothetical protein